MKRQLFRIWLYENRSLYIVVAFFGLSMNAIFLAGPSEALLDALIYADMLYVIFFSLYTVLAFQKFHRVFSPLLESIRTSSIDETTLHVSSMLPNSNDLCDPFIALLKEVVTAQQNEHIKMESALFNEIQSIEDYATLWAHEIKTPLSILLMTAQQIDSPKVKNSILEEIERIQHLAEQFLYFSRSHSFTKDFLVSEVSLKKFSSDCIKKHARALIAKNIAIEMSVSEYHVFSDAKWLGYIIEQLLVNAIKYTSEGGRIQIYTSSDVNGCHLTIEDTGIGIDLEDLPRIFDRGFTGKTGRQSGSSTGMGLYLANKLSQMLTHTLTVVSEKDKGTRITLSFTKF